MAGPASRHLVTATDPDLAALAASCGVSTEYWDQSGQRREVPADTVRAVLAAMGVRASTRASCRSELTARQRAHWLRVLPQIVVLRQSEARGSGAWETWVHVRPGGNLRLWIELEDGGRRFDLVPGEQPVRTGKVRGREVTEVVYRLPRDLPLGWHQLVAEADSERAACPLVIAPERLTLPDGLADRRGWGLAAQLYSVRSRRSWGLGDLDDLRELASWTGRELGADFVLVNPLQAASPVPPIECSPYLPGTRRYTSPLYIRVEAIPEYAYLDAKSRGRISKLRAGLPKPAKGSRLLERDPAWAAKRAALELVHQVALEPGRQSQFRAFREREGAELRAFATWCALAEAHGAGWDEWPDDFADPASPAIAAEALRLAPGIAFHTWLQWVADEQLVAAQHEARYAGMAVGIMHDLAIGVHKFGPETWAQPELTASQVTVGAPPDDFNQQGQNWDQPPSRPDTLAETGYASYRDMLRAILRHGGGLRIDHILGLFRLWWIPEGKAPSAGTYVRYDHQVMVDILVLEAHRAGALVVGEDLGTVEPWVRDFLAERGILGTTILWFEKDLAGRPALPGTWRQNAMAAVTVHDLPPTLGYLSGDHVRLRDQLGLLNRPIDQEWAAFSAELDGWRQMLLEQGFLRPDASDQQMLIALHRLLARSPSPLLCVSLADLVGERRTQNQPGTGDEYPNWRIPLCGPDGEPVLIEDLPHLDLLRSVVSALGVAPARA